MLFWLWITTVPASVHVSFSLLSLFHFLNPQPHWLWKRENPPSCWFEDGGGHCEKERGQPLGVERGPWLTAGKETGPQSYNCQELGSDDNLNEARSSVFP